MMEGEAMQAQCYLCRRVKRADGSWESRQQDKMIVATHIVCPECKPFHLREIDRMRKIEFDRQAAFRRKLLGQKG